ncbi:hypothetical protein ACFLZW_04690 [Chloroflexota bacterium]
MLFGHLGVGFAVKPAAQNAPLWALLVAGEGLDFLSFAFEAVGLETFAESQVSFNRGIEFLSDGSIPLSHGLLMSVFWSLAAAAITFLLSRDRRTAGIIGLVVFSHWVLDFIVHPPDLPLLFGGSPEVGLGLWASGPGFITSIILEVCMLAGGMAIYWVARKRATVSTSL